MKKLSLILTFLFCSFFAFSQNWIKAKDSVPQTRERVLCFARKPTNLDIYNVFVGYYENGKWKAEAVREYDNTGYFLVTNWRPLPVPPAKPAK